MGVLDGKRVLMIIAPRNFRDEEFQEPYGILHGEGAQIKIASTTTDTARGMFGATAEPDITVDEVAAADYDAILFIGGSGSQVYFDDPTAQRIARDAVEAGKVLGAICIAPVTLANAGVLEGKKATSFDSVAGMVESGGARHTAAPVERDGLLVTATGPESATQFGREIALMLAE